jgi:Lrp/AsnC family transcriptional regulator, leucine-responsive regulatory protein
MKNISPKLIDLFKKGYCTPQILKIARQIKEPSATLHYNIKKLEKEKIILAYKAVFDYKKIDEGHCTYIMINLNREQYADPEKTSKKLAEDPKIESIDICTGEFELLIKLRTKDIDEYYEWIKQNIKNYGFTKTRSITSLKQVKTEFIKTP